MNSRLLYAAFYLAIAIWSYFDWNKYKNKDNLWFLCLSVIGAAAELGYFILIVVQASPNILSDAKWFFSIFDPVLIILVIWIGVRSIVKKR